MGLFNGKKTFKGGIFYDRFVDTGDGANELMLVLSHVEKAARAVGIQIAGEPQQLDAGGFWFVNYRLADGGDLSIDPRSMGQYADFDVNLESKYKKDTWVSFMTQLGAQLLEDGHFDNPRTPNH